MEIKAMPDVRPISDADVERALRAVRDYFRELISESQLYEGELLEFFKSLTAESPRALAVVAFSYIDEKLATLMRQHMNPDISGGLDSLFKSFGPLSTASGRIKIAASLRWLRPSTYRHLEVLRKIRNEFAHSPFLNSFDEAPVRDFLGQFEPLEKALWSFMDDRLLPYEGVSRRQLYHLRATLTCARMIEEVTCAPRAISMGLSPSALHEDGFSVVPKPFKELVRASLEVAMHVAPKPI
ncbi:hypothetical protein ACXU4B_03625 [Dyella soli]|uniref:Uncharacterized protein n=1 Tax=Dyella soli TaxID=522319 RepID=A0A4R0YTB7_9GAMM|nr:hypothetical protein [Dyella soli]TCI10128.1 hypothetical protein EZM97_14510 [Dyella soli]